jgi:hypothetical protein
VWSSEFTIKVATTQGGYGKNRCYAERKILGSGGSGAWLVVVSNRFSGTAEPNPLFESILIFENNFKSSPKNLAQKF